LIQNECTSGEVHQTANDLWRAVTIIQFARKREINGLIPS
jgi:hypothetical protein